eukprot:1912044-Rhodomonas_salina.1
MAVGDAEPGQPVCDVVLRKRMAVGYVVLRKRMAVGYVVLRKRTAVGYAVQRQCMAVGYVIWIYGICGTEMGYGSWVCGTDSVMVQEPGQAHSAAHFYRLS